MKKASVYVLAKKDNQYILEKYSGYDIDNDYSMYKHILNNKYYEYVVIHKNSGCRVVYGYTIKQALKELDDIRQVAKQLLNKDYVKKYINTFHTLLKNNTPASQN